MKNITKFIFECYSLKLLKRSGSIMFNQDLGSIAEHSFLTSIIGLVLATKENVDANKVVLMCLLHDTQETRTGDLNFVQKKYQISNEKGVLLDQVSMLDNKLKKILIDNFANLKKGKSKISIIVKDADILEQMFCEKIAEEKGNKQAAGWLKYSLKQLKTTSAKKLGRILIKSQSNSWWQNLYNKPNLSSQ